MVSKTNLAFENELISAGNNFSEKNVSGQKIELDFDIALTYSVLGSHADFIFNIHAARTDHQSVLGEQLHIDQAVPYGIDEDAHGNRWLRLRARSGALTVKYAAAVSLVHAVTAPEHIVEMPIADMPLEVLPYLRASRYCQSDRLIRLAANEFGAIAPGYRRVLAVQDWVRRRVSFRPQTSDITTSAMDTLIEQVGVCRDYAHLMIALCRALSIPARFATGIDYGADPALGPVDFHAYVEVYLSGRWYIFDPSGLAIPMGFVRIGTGRDAGDCAFAIMFGNVQAGIPVLSIAARDDPARNVATPFHTRQLLSTAAL